MVSGALVIGTDSGGTKELIKDRETGYLYSGDAASLEKVLEAAINDKPGSRMVAKKAQEWAAGTFSTENNAKEIIQIYEEVRQMR